MGFHMTARQALEEDLRTAADAYTVAKDNYISWIVSAAEHGMTQREIGIIIEKAPSTVKAILAKAGVKYERRAIIPL